VSQYGDGPIQLREVVLLRITYVDHAQTIPEGGQHDVRNTPQSEHITGESGQEMEPWEIKAGENGVLSDRGSGAVVLLLV
jgi:hypothetical protein